LDWSDENLDEEIDNSLNLLNLFNYFYKQLLTKMYFYFVIGPEANTHSNKHMRGKCGDPSSNLGST